jgi:hypothetical protein
VKSVEKKKSVADHFTVYFMTGVLSWPVTQKPNKEDYGVDKYLSSCCCKRVNTVEKDKHSCFDLTKQLYSIGISSIGISTLYSKS